MSKKILWVYTRNSYMKNNISFDGLFKTAKKLNLKTLAFINCDNLDCIKGFFHCAIKAKIKPIIGMKMYVLPFNGFVRESQMDGKETAHHISLLPFNNKGYENLVRLASLSSLDSYKNRPSVTKECLSLHKVGLIASSGSTNGVICQHILNGQIEEAFKIVKEYAETFEEGNFYIELHANYCQLNKSLISIAKKLNLPLISFNLIEEIVSLKKWYDASENLDQNQIFLKEFLRNEVIILNIENFKKINERKIEFEDTPEIFNNTQKIIQKIDFTIEERNCYPIFDETEGISDFYFLDKVATENFVSQETIVEPKYFQRLKSEIRSVFKRGLASYFLIVWDLFRYLSQKGIAVTHHYDLWPEQILLFSLGVPSLEIPDVNEFADNLPVLIPPIWPKIEVEIISELKQEVIEYILFKYGSENLLLSQSEKKMMTAQESLIDIRSNQEIDQSIIDEITNHIDENSNTSLYLTLRNNAYLLKKYEGDLSFKKVYLMARDYEFSKTNCVYVEQLNKICLSAKPIFAQTPLSKKDKGIKLQYSSDMLDKWGFLEINIKDESLALSLINKTIALIKTKRQIQLTRSQIPLNDEKTYSMLLKWHFTGLGREEYLDKEIYMTLKPKNIQEITDAFSLSEPWINKKQVDHYVGVKSGQIKVKTEHPIVTEVLTPTYGLLLYTEQAQQIANQMSGFSAKEVDDIHDFDNYRKPSWITKNREKFISHAQNKGIPKEVARKTYKRLMNWCYQYLSLERKNAILFYQTAYLKFHYSEEYMTTLIKANIDNAEKIEEFKLECKRLKIEF